MIFILNDLHSDIGGAEIFLIEFAKYLQKNRYKVYFLIGNNDFYESRLKSTNIRFIHRSYIDRIELMNDKQIEKEKNRILKEISKDEDYIVVSLFFQTLHYAMAIFNGCSNIQLFYIWPHPEDWIKAVKIIGKRDFNLKIINNRKYYYQKELLSYLQKKNAMYYGSRIVPIYNSWYYGVDFNPTTVEALPIQSIADSDIVIHKKLDSLHFSVLWVGRFDYWKNEAIIHIFIVLERIALLYPNISFEFGIIGYGDDKNQNYIYKNISPINIDVKFIGKVDPESLVDYFYRYDVGIGMGLSVKKMAQAGLPSIIIDSFEKKVPHPNNSNWLFNTTEGDAGDGYYFKIAGKELSSRRPLIELFQEVVEAPRKIEIYSARCIEYVEKYYSAEKQFAKLIEQANASEFCGERYPIYRVNIIYRYLFLSVRFVYRKLKLIRYILKKSVRKR